VLCLLFDIKDSVNDFLSGVNTYANKFGSYITKLMCLFFVTGGFISFYLFNHQPQFLFSSIVLRLLVIGTILFTNDKRHSFYYYLWVDGLLIVQTMLFLF
jgi:hypothetical protein